MQKTDEPNERTCRRCRQPISPRRPSAMLAVPEAAAHMAAWLNGFCSAMCNENYALDLVAAGGAWWQQKGNGQ
jgi:hypothetical protein